MPLLLACVASRLRCFSPALLLACAFSGCHAPPTSPDGQLSKQLTPASARGLSIQQSPKYQEAVRLYAHHNYQAALADINFLLAQPAYRQNPAENSFLLHQRSICRHALDPRVALNDLPASSPPIPHSAPFATASADCGPRALLLLCPQFGVHTTLATLRQRAGTTAKGTTLQGLANAAHSVGLKAKGVQVDKLALAQISVPAIVWYDGNHYVDLLSISDEQVTIHDPNKPAPEQIPTNELLGRSSGILLTLSH